MSFEDAFEVAFDEVDFLAVVLVAAFFDEVLFEFDLLSVVFFEVVLLDDLVVVAA